MQRDSAYEPLYQKARTDIEARRGAFWLGWAWHGGAWMIEEGDA